MLTSKELREKADDAEETAAAYALAIHESVGDEAFNNAMFRQNMLVRSGAIRVADALDEIEKLSKEKAENG